MSAISLNLTRIPGRGGRECPLNPATAITIPSVGVRGKLKEVVAAIARSEALEERHRDHALSGK